MRISLGLGLFLASRPFCERNYSRLNDSSAKGLLRCDPAHQFIYFNEEHNWCSHLLLSIITLNFLVQLEGVSQCKLGWASIDVLNHFHPLCQRFTGYTVSGTTAHTMSASLSSSTLLGNDLRKANVTDRKALPVFSRLSAMPESVTHEPDKLIAGTRVTPAPAQPTLEW